MPKHPIVWSLGLILVAALIYLLYTSGSSFTCGKEGEKLICGFSKEQQYESKLMHGYFYTLDEKGGTVCVSEHLNLKFYEDKITVKSDSEGNVHNEDGKLINNGWLQSGFRHGNSISLAYVTKSNSPTGTGVYYLMENGSYYSGYWMGLDFPLGHKVQCPYLLTSIEKPETESCERRWPETFNGQPCVILKHR
jgi:hypothetical protein